MVGTKKGADNSIILLGKDFLKTKTLGPLGGSAVEHLLSAQGVILESQDRVPRPAPGMEPASPSASLSIINK